MPKEDLSTTKTSTRHGNSKSGSRRERIVGTRKEKYKRDAALKKRSEDDPSTQAAELKRKLDEARAKAAAAAKPVSEEIIDVED
jgi:hypothetical protein